MKLKLPKEFNSYKPKVTFQIEEGNFIIKIAETKEELLGAFHLRHNVFYKERKGVCFPSQISTDEFDIHGDQLIIINKDNGQVMGAYRFIPAQGPKGIEYFCNQKYFNLTPFIKTIKNHNVVEMEWACTDKGIRTSRAIHYLWLGMARYFRITFSKYLCGQVNVLNSSVEESAGIYKTLVKEKLTHYEGEQKEADTLIQAVASYSIKDFDKVLSKAPADTKYLSKISRLFLWYLKMGAKVHGPPMFDPEFNSYGFFMSLDFQKIQNPFLVNQYKDGLYLKNNLPAD